MSFFDPQKLYEKPQYHSHKGQILQKKAYNRLYALSDRDLETAKNVMDSYGYSYFDHPIISDSDFYIGHYQFNGNLRGTSWNLFLLPLRPLIISNSIIQSSKPVDEFSLNICLVSAVLKLDVLEDSSIQFGNYKIGSISFTADTDGDNIVITNTMYSSERYLYTLGTNRAINPVVNDRLFSQQDGNPYLYRISTNDINEVKNGTFFDGLSESKLIYGYTSDQQSNIGNIYISIQYTIYAKYSL